VYKYTWSRCVTLQRQLYSVARLYRPLSGVACSLPFCLELAPMWLSRSSQTSFDSQAKHDGTPSIFSPSTSDPNKQFLPIRASTVTVPASIEQRPREPRSPLRISTTIISPPPAARRGSIPSLNPRSPIRASFVTMTWPPSPTSRSGHYPEHEHGERPVHD
jgi:hypothetical protein